MVVSVSLGLAWNHVKHIYFSFKSAVIKLPPRDRSSSVEKSGKLINIFPRNNSMIRMEKENKVTENETKGTAQSIQIKNDSVKSVSVEKETQDSQVIKCLQDTRNVFVQTVQIEEGISR